MKLRWSSFRCAIAGIMELVRRHHHARWHLVASILVTALGLTLGLSRLEWIALVLAMALVWVAEALNTAIELACDAITLDRHPLIGKAKDVAAGGVLLAAIFAAIVGLLVFGARWPR